MPDNECPVSVNGVSSVHITANSVPAPEQPQRTFTSTEAQTDCVLTDDIAAALPYRCRNAVAVRSQRRLERRQRRNRRPPQPPIRPPPLMRPPPQNCPLINATAEVCWSTAASGGAGMEATTPAADSDTIHLPPPYTTLPLGVMPLPRFIHHQMRPPSPPAGRFPMNIMTPIRFPPRCESRDGVRYVREEEEPKSCCGLSVSRTISIRWFVLVLFVVGLGCAFIGTVMAAMRGAAGRDHINISLLMIGFGLLLVTISGLVWRLTCAETPSCGLLLGISGTNGTAPLVTSDGTEVNRSRFMPRLPPSYGRPHHPYAAMMYPEFQYRPPPPSYQASMQEYRLRLLLMDRQQNGHPTPSLPPPIYRNQQDSPFRPIIGYHRRDGSYYQSSHSDYSRPPSYRSRSSSCRPACHGATSVSTTHSRDHSQLSLQESATVPDGPVDEFKMEPAEVILEEAAMEKSESGDDLMTIGQSTPRIDQGSPIIVAVPGVDSRCRNAEMDILAQL